MGAGTALEQTFPILTRIKRLLFLGAAGWAVTAIEIAWWRKYGTEIREAFQELQRSRVGRNARISGTVERLAAEFQKDVANTI
jgi:hypothetical protein